MRLTRRLAPHVDKHKRAIVGCWLVLVAVSAYFAPGLVNATSSAFGPPPGSAASLAKAQVRASFPGQAGSTQFVVLLESTAARANRSGDTERDDRVTGAAPNILDNAGVRAFTERLYNDTKAKPIVTRFASYYTLLATGMLPAELGSFLDDSSDPQATLIQIQIESYPTDPATFSFLGWLEARIKPDTPQTSENAFHVSLVGSPLIIRESTTIAMEDLEKMDLIVLPLAFLVLALLLRSWRLMLLPVATMGTSAATTFGLVALVARVTPIYTITPSLMMSVLIAMAFDYALFMLTRFKEEMLAHGQVYMAVERMLSTAGYTITVSGLTLAVSFIALLFFPINIISSLGLGCFIALSLTLVVNLTLLPALLLCFPGFFGAARTCCPQHGRAEGAAAGARTRTQAQAVQGQGEVSPARVGPVVVSADDDGWAGRQQEAAGDEKDTIEQEATLLPKHRPAMSGCWKYVAVSTTSTIGGWAIILLTCGLTVPLAIKAFQLETTDGWVAALPHGSQVSVAFEQLGKKFGYGLLSPYTILIRPRGGGSVMTPGFFNASSHLLAHLAHLPGLHDTTPDCFSSAVYDRGVTLPFPFVEQCVNSTATACAAVHYVIDTFVSRDGQASYAVVELPWDPLGRFGEGWLRTMRAALLKAHDDYPRLDVWLSGLPADSYDAIDAVYGLLPLMAAATCSLVLLLVGVSFQSAVIPLRTVFTISITLLWGYGAAVLVYQEGVLDWLQFDGLAGQKAQEWLVPVISFPIIVGISLDYDIFLLARIAEAREDAMTTRNAVQHGLYHTGPTITTAGIIMALAFSGLLFSRLLTCNQLSFYLVFAVLFDTFVVRTFLVPALMGRLQSLNWWPSSLVFDRNKWSDVGGI